MPTQAANAATTEKGDAALAQHQAEREPDPLDPPRQDPDDPDLAPEQDDDFVLPGEEDEYAAPAVEPHEEPLVTP